MIQLTGAALSLAQIGKVGRDGASLAPAARDRIAAAAAAVHRIAHHHPVYGRSTGVGANRDTPFDPADADRMALDLLRSHAAPWGPTADPTTTRAAIAIRLNQLATGRSGLSLGSADALAQLLVADDGDLPVLQVRGDLGTGDLSAFATVGLALAGERPRRDGRRHRSWVVPGGDALPLLSTNAFTLACTASVIDRIRLRLAAVERITALDLVAYQGSSQAFDPEVVRAAAVRVQSAAVAQRVTALMAEDVEPSRALQDFYGLRAMPQVHGEALHRLGDVVGVVEVGTGTGIENPLVLHDPGGPERVAHHGSFHQVTLATSVDALTEVLVSVGALSLSRTSHLLAEPPPAVARFVATGPAGSSGLLIAEYQAASALARLRLLAGAPVATQTVSLSANIEDHASSAPLAVERLGEVVDALDRVLAAEWLVARELLAARGAHLRGPLAADLDLLSAPALGADRDLGPELDAATAAIATLGAAAD